MKSKRIILLCKILQTKSKTLVFLFSKAFDITSSANILLLFLRFSYFHKYFTVSNVPYLDSNTTSVTMTPSATSGSSITITASAPTFVSGDVNRLIKFSNGYAKITAFGSDTSVTASVEDDFDNFCDESGRNDEIFDFENSEPKETSNESTTGDAELPKKCKTMAPDIDNMKGNPGELSKKISSRFSKISEQ